MLELVDSFIQFITAYQDYTYGVILIILLASGAGLPLSKDAFLIASGIIAGIIQRENHHALTVMLIICITGVILGDCIMFYLGRTLGFRIQRYWPFSRIITPKRFAKLRKYYKHYGIWFIVIARFVPVIRMPLYVFCGMTRKIKFRIFVLINGSVSVVYTSIWVLLGYFFAFQKDQILQYVPGINIIFISCAALLIAVLIIYHCCSVRKTRQVLQKKKSKGAEL